MPPQDKQQGGGGGAIARGKGQRVRGKVGVRGGGREGEHYYHWRELPQI